MYTFEEDTKQETTLASVDKDWMRHIVRSLGMLLLLFGLWAGIGVLLEAFQLYRNPIRIEALATAIEHGSNINKTLTPGRNRQATDAEAQAGAGRPGSDELQLSYFVAWIVALMLLLLISMIAFTAIKTGGELVLYETKLRRISDDLVKALRKVR